jgi:DNA repair exonuclease SbcCD nuclease subunit
MDRLASVMTTDFAKDFGETEYHYIDVGHIHHRTVMKEYSGISIESWNQLAASDKWAHEAGYRSRKSISIAFRSRTYGQTGTITLPIEKIRDRIMASMGPAGYTLPVERRAFAA